MEGMGITSLLIMLAFIPCVVAPVAVLVYLFMKGRRK